MTKPIRAQAPVPEFHYLPYEEIQFAWEGEGSFSLTAPWVHLVAQYNAADRERLSRIERVLQGKLSADKARADLDWLLTLVLAYPLAYTLPRAVGAFTDERWAEAPSLPLEKSTPQNLLPKVSPESSPQVAAGWAWRWREEEILERARIAGTDHFDALTLLTALRRLRLKELHRYAVPDAKNRLSALLRADESRFIEFTVLSLRQTHFVTASCQQALSPAKDAYRPATELIQAYLDSERGHEHLVSHSLRELGCRDPKEVAVLEETRALMGNLRYAAEKHFVAFAILVEAFEAGVDADLDPMAEVLLQSARTARAARGIQKHHEINRRQQHVDISRHLLAGFPPIDRVAARVAIRLSDLHSMLVESGYLRLLRRLEAA